jgi:hypothetical protein
MLTALVTNRNLKFVKNMLGTSMGDDSRLVDHIILTCDKDHTNILYIETISKKWSY